MSNNHETFLFSIFIVIIKIKVSVRYLFLSVIIVTDQFILGLFVGGVIVFVFYLLRNKPEYINSKLETHTQAQHLVTATNAIEETQPQDIDLDVTVPKVAKAKEEAENQQVIEICKSIISSSSPTFILGKAGTGKTTLIKLLSNLSHFKNHVVLAPTGVAALNAGGQTIHSFFHLPPRIMAPEDLELKRTPKAWKNVEYIFIDEISMVRCDVIDLVDKRLRSVRDPDLQFGGAKLVMFGDFFQLPPVCPTAEAEILKKMGYTSVYAFSAKALSKSAYKSFELDKVHRQTQLEFIESLNALRKNEKTQFAVDYFNRSCFGEHRLGAQPVTLMGSNAEVNAFNRLQLESLNGKITKIEAVFRGNFNLTNDRLPAPELLELKIGARVIALKNDALKKWINGSLGTVRNIKRDAVFVDFDHGVSEWVRPLEWENVKYNWSDKDQKPIAEVVGTFTQMPLNLAWALTIHKAQGKTLSDVRIELSGAFVSGQTYVALSRARQIEGLSLSRKLSANDVFTDNIVEDFYTEITKKTPQDYLT